MVIWDGSYKSAEEAFSRASDERPDMIPFEMQMFDVTKSYWRSFNQLDEVRKNGILLEACILAFYSVYHRELSVADIGGGVGSHLIEILNSRLNEFVKAYYLIETEEMAKYAGWMRSTNERSVILSGFPDNLSIGIPGKNIDLIYLNCSFQYIFPTELSVETMKMLAPRIICIDRVLVGQVPTFYTVQKNLKYDTVAKFMNEDEFIDLFKRNGYEVIYKYEREFQWNMDNFKEELRLKKLPGYILIQNEQTEYKEKILDFVQAYILYGIKFLL